MPPTAPPPPISSPPSSPVTLTTDLANGTALPGDFVPAGGASPTSAAFDPALSELFVTCYWSNDLRVVSTTSGEVVGTVDGLQHPEWVAYDAVDREFYVTSAWNASAFALTAISAASLQVVSSSLVPGFATPVAVDPVLGLVYVGMHSVGAQGLWALTASGLAHVRTVQLTGTANGFAFGPSYQDLFVIAQSNALVEINESTGLEVTSIVLPIYAQGIAFDPVDGNLDLEGDPIAGSDMLVLVSATTLQILHETSVPVLAMGVAADPVTGEVFVAEFNGSADLAPNGPGNVSVYAPSSGAELSQVKVGEGPWGLATGLPGEVAVMDERGDQITFLSTSSFAVDRSTPLGIDPVAMAVDSPGGLAFVANDGSDNVTVITLATGATLKSIPVGNYPRAVAFDPSTGSVYVANAGSGNISILSVRSLSVAATIGFGVNAVPCGLADDPIDGLMWVALGTQGEIAAINTTTLQVTSMTFVGVEPFAMIYDPSYHSIDVSSIDSNTVTFVTYVRGVDAIVTFPSMGYAPYALALDPGSSRLFVANAYSSNVTVLNSGTGALEASLPLAGNAMPLALLYDSQALVVAATGLDQVVLFSTWSLTEVTHFSVGTHPDAIVEAPLGPMVANYGSTSVSWVRSQPTVMLQYQVTPTAGGCDMFWIDGETVWNGSSEAVLEGTHNVTAPAYCPGDRSFLYWQTTGGIAWTGSGSSATLDVSGNGTVIAVYAPDVGQVAVTVLVSPAFCGNVLWNSFSTQPNGSMFTTMPATYPISAPNCVGYTFGLWVATGSLSLTDPSLGSTTAVVGGVEPNATVNAEFFSVGSGGLALSLSASPSSGIAPLTVDFLSSVSGGAPPYTYLWRFGDGSTSSSPDPSHLFVSTGSYFSTLFVTDSGSNSVQQGIQINVEGNFSLFNVQEVASVTSGPSPLSVAFTSVVSGGTPPYTYAWQLGDGSTSTGPSVTHTYTQVGSFDSNLQVQDANGSVARTQLWIDVTPGPVPLSVSILPASESIVLGSSAQWSAQTSGGSAPYTYDWAQLPPGCAPVSVPFLTCTPSRTGTFTLVLEVTDAASGFARASASVTVVPPSSGKGASSTQGLVGTAVSSALIVSVLVATVAWLVLLRRERDLRRSEMAPFSSGWDRASGAR